MPATDKILDDAIRTAITGGGTASLQAVISGLFQAMTQDTIRSLGNAAADRNPGPRVKVVGPSGPGLLS